MRGRRDASSARTAARLEAAEWVVRLQRADRDQVLEDSFRRWLDSDPLHRIHFYGATSVWETLGGLQSAQGRTARRRVAPPLVLALASTTVVAFAGLIGWEVLAPTRAYDTVIGEQRAVTLADGSRLSLNTDTRVKVKLSLLRRDVRIERGEAMFEVAKNPWRPFTVRAEGRAVRALGTAFIVRTGRQGAAVTLLEGSVSVSRDRLFADEREAVLSPGQQWNIGERRVAQLSPLDLEAAGSWRRREAIFENTTLPDAVAEMNRYSGTRIVVVGPATQLRVSGVFKVGESESFARTVSALYGLELQTDGAEIRIRPPSV